MPNTPKNTYRQLKSFTFSSPNREIIGASMAFWVIFLLISLASQGTWHDFFINLSAGAITVAFTVLLVDGLRARHERAQNAVPKRIALTQMRSEHTSLLLQLLVHHYRGDKTFANELTQVGGAKNAKNSNAFINFLIDSTLKLASKDELLKNITDEDLQTNFKKLLEALREGLIKRGTRYGFALHDVTLQADYANLLTALDNAISSFAFYDIDRATLNKIVTSSDDKREVTPRTYVVATLSQYIRMFDFFIRKHLDDAQS